jgi:hypothetical protein
MIMDSNETIFAETGSIFIGADPVGTSSGHASDWSPVGLFYSSSIKHIRLTPSRALKDII